MTDIDKLVKVVMRPDWKTAGISSYRNWSLFFNMAVWAGYKQAMKRPRSEKKDAVCAQTTLKNRKTTNSRLKTEAVSGAHDMEEENSVDKIEKAAYSTLTEEGWATMTRPVKEWPSCAPFTK